MMRRKRDQLLMAKSSNDSFMPAKGKIHIYHEKGETYFEIMKTGKDHLLSLIKQGSACN